MKKIRYILSALAAITGLAVLAACAQIVAPSEYLAGRTTGRVILSVSTGAENARTILPTDKPVFSRYEVDFASGDTIVHVPDTSGITGAGVSQELAAGTWTVTVRAYRQFTPTDGTETEYLAARGNASVTVKEQELTPVTVPLTPVPITDTTVKGIFTFTVTFPEGVKAYLTLGSGGNGGSSTGPEESDGLVLSSGQTVSVEKDPGYYDLFIMLQKGPLTAGTAEKVHIYSGLESKAEFTFEDVDFVQPVPLQDKTWKEGNLIANMQVDWYSFSAAAGVTYSLQLDSLGGTGNYTGEVFVVAFDSDGEFLDASNEYSSPLILRVDTNDTIYVGVLAYENTGTYAIRYYDPSTEPPIAPSHVQMEMPQQDYTYTIRWDPVGGATGYKVSRSTTKEGPYADIGSTVPDDGSYFYSFTDTGVSSGTYWYQVRAVNGHGDGPDSAPVSTPMLLPNDKTWTQGNTTTYGQVDWYSFPVTAGVTYSVQLDSLGYTGTVHVGAYQGSDGMHINSIYSGYSSLMSWRAYTNDTIYLEVQGSGSGTYAVRYYDSSTEPPAAPFYVQMKFPYTITWNSAGGATGYKVSRSTTEEGPYAVIGSITGEYSDSFTDTGVSSGTYWYKVRAVNEHGEGPDSEPVKVSAATLLPNDKTWAQGNFTAYEQVDCYSFPATANVTYSLQVDSFDSPGNYTAGVYVQAYRGSDGYYLASGSGDSFPWPLRVDTDDTIYARVQSNGQLGTYAVRYYDSSTEPPAAPSYVQMWAPDYTIRWDPVGGATSYKVSRSTAEKGSYAVIGSTTGEYSNSFTDTGVSSGAYWYKVRAVNEHGEGPDSEPVEVSASTLLPNDKTWTQGNFAAYGQVDWYSFPATAGVTYSVQLDSLGYTGIVNVEAYRGSNGMYLNSLYSEYSPLMSLSVDTNDTIYMKVQAYGDAGTYAVRYYDSSTEPPTTAPAYVQMGMPQPDYTITWNSVGGATGYKVSRSATEEGTYAVRGSTTGEYSASFTDTGASSGTYWYKVRAVNGYGDGPDSEPVKVSAPTLLPNDKTWAQGNLAVYNQVDWYSFPATAGVTYSVQLDSLGGTGNYPGMAYVEAYRGSDGMHLNSSYEYSSPLTLRVYTDDTIYVRVQVNGNLGTYAVRYYDSSTEPPTAPSYVDMWLPDYTIIWGPAGGATSFKVSRSTTKEGPYAVIATTGEYSNTYTDTSVSSGAYWYKVRAVNGHGEGPDSEPVKVSAPTLLPNDKTWAQGNLAVYNQVDWYSFPVTANVTYSLQFDSLGGPGNYTGAVYVMVLLYRNGGGDYVDSFPLSLRVDTDDTIYVRVQVGGALGTYAVRYEETEDGPKEPPRQ